MTTCATCKYFLAVTEADGLCRRFPPVPLVYPNGPTVSVFPPMLNEGYCGEFKEKEVSV